MLTPHSNTNASRKQRLLIGEKNPAVREFLLSVFAAEGYEVVGAANGIDLLDTVMVSLHPEFGSGEFDLVISETQMLGETELQQAFGGLEAPPKVPPIILISGFGAKVPAVQARPFESVAVLEEPLDIARLRDLVNTTLRNPPRQHGDRSLHALD